MGRTPGERRLARRERFHSGRWPGDGRTQQTDAEVSAGYTGAFDLELIGPRIDSEGRVEAVRRAADRLGEILHSLGV